MNDRNSLCGVILAAGFSSRMGREKALLPWPPESNSGTLLSASISALKVIAEHVIVVAGKNARDIASVVAERGAMLILNPAPERGQFSSLRTGLRAALDAGADAVLITPVDCPPLSAGSLEGLRTSFEQARLRGSWGIAPEDNGRHGHPLFAARPLIDAFLNAPESSNARDVKHEHAGKIEYVEVAEPLLTVDLNTPEQYAAAAARDRRR